MKQILILFLLASCVACSSTKHIKHHKKKYQGVKTAKVNIPDKFFYYSQPKLDMK